MAASEVIAPQLYPDQLKSRFDLYGRWSVFEVDNSAPGLEHRTAVKVRDHPQDFCSNSFMKIGFRDDGVCLYDAHPGEGDFIAKIFEFEKTWGGDSPVLVRSVPIPLSTRQVGWSNSTAQEVHYSWRNGVRHRYLISACFPCIRVTIVDSFRLAIQLRCEYVEGSAAVLQRPGAYQILWGGIEQDTPLLVAFPSGSGEIQLRGDILLFTSACDRFSVHIGPLFGAALVDTRGIEKPPKDWVERATLLADGSCNIPIASNETYQVDEAEGRIRIQRHFERSELKPFGGGEKTQDVAVYPPAVFYPKTEGRPESGKSYDIYTLYGKTWMTQARDVTYSFATPPEIEQKLAIPSLDEVKGEFASRIVGLINDRVERELDETQEFPKFDNSAYAFVGLAQQMLACHPLLRENVKKKLLAWTRRHLEYYFNQKWVSQDFFGFSYPEGHWKGVDIDCYVGDIFLCLTHYLEASRDVEFARAILPKIKAMLNYFRIAVDPMMSNGFCSPSWHINWVSDTLETVAGLLGLARLARCLGDEIWEDVVGFATVYRCGAIGQLLGAEIYREIPGLPTKASWLFDHWDCKETMLNWYVYALPCVIAIDATQGFIPLAYDKSFWHCYLPFWPPSPELCLLHMNLGWRERFADFYKVLEDNWPDWRMSNKATFAHGAPFLIFRALYGQETPESLLDQYLQGEAVHKVRPFLEFTRWKHFFFAVLLVDPNRPIARQNTLVKGSGAAEG